MAKVTWSAPAVQYARCEIEFEGPDSWLSEPEKMGAAYAQWVAGVMKGFEDEQRRIRSDKVSKAAEAVVKASEGLNERLGPVDGGDIQKAVEALSEGLGGVTVESEEPWNAPAPKKSEPWKNGGPVRKPAEIVF